MFALLLLACAGPASEDTAAPFPGDPDYVRDPALDAYPDQIPSAPAQ